MSTMIAGHRRANASKFLPLLQKKEHFSQKPQKISRFN
jgi:hypothetical protein